MKAMLEQLVRRVKKRRGIKLQEEKITRLTRKLEKRPAQSLTKSSESEEEERASVQSEASDEEVHSKKGGKLKNGGSPSLMTFEQIQDLIVNAVKIQLGGDVYKTRVYIKPYTKRVDNLYMPHGY